MQRSLLPSHQKRRFLSPFPLPCQYSLSKVHTNDLGALTQPCTTKGVHCVNELLKHCKKGEENPAAVLAGALLRLRLKTDTEVTRFSSHLQALLLSNNFRIKTAQEYYTRQL